MGLLDFMNTPEGQGLLSAAFGGMAGARRGAPINSIGIAGLSGVRGYSDAIDQQNRQQDAGVDRQLRQMQIAQMQEADARRKKSEETLASFLPTLPQQDQQAYALGVPYQDIWKSRNTDRKMQLVTVNTPNGPMQRWVKEGESNGIDIGAPENKESALPWYAHKGVDGKISIDPAFADLERTKASFGRPPAQPMQPVAYVDDKGNTVWGTIAEAKGRPAANFSPTVQGAITNAKEQGKVTGQSTATAQVELPSAVAQAEQAINLSDDLLKHPGFGSAVGLSSAIDPRNYINGTDAKDFQIRLDQIKGQQFMQAYQGLKGGGQITEIEGKKATDAISRMNTAASEPEFKKAVEDFKTVIKQGLDRAKSKAGGKQSAISSGGWSATVVPSN